MAFRLTRAGSAPLTLAVLFALITGLPLAALASLGWHVFNTERAQERGRIVDQLDAAAGQIVREIERNLASWEELAGAAARGEDAALPAGAIVFALDAGGVHWLAGRPRLPGTPASAHVPAHTFDHVDGLERRGALVQAAAGLRTLASAGDGAVRGEALVRLARVLRRQQHNADALDVYGELAPLGELPVLGFPAELIARRERIVLLGVQGDTQQARTEAARLAAVLIEGKFDIHPAAFALFAKTAGHFWSDWLDMPQGRSAWTSDSGAFVSVWRPVADATAVLAGPADALFAPAADIAQSLGATLSVEDVAGVPAWGEAGAEPTSTVTTALREAGLPWTLRVAPGDPAASASEAARRRTLYLAGLALMAMVIASASFFVFRAVNRELRVARLQSAFVAAVSHEFRTPLTAMCHLTEILEEDGATPQRLPEYYRALGHESRRLHAMVERLLDFGRMEAGQQTYEFDIIGVRELVADIVEETREQVFSTGHQIAFHAPGDGGHIRADRAALTLAIRNLIDNAAKYSPPSTQITVSAVADARAARISVADEGLGIPGDERPMMFHKFARGRAAKQMNVKGTGLGLAMVAEIVRAHGGRVDVASEVGRGSTFVVSLPRVS